MSKRWLPRSRLEIVTNGDMLKPAKVADLHAAGLDALLVSMYDGPEQIPVLEAIRDEAGVPADWMLLRERYLPPEQNFGINLSNRAGMVTGLENLGVAALAEPLKHPCFYVHYRMMVDHNGDVLLCPHDWGKRLIAGNLTRDNIVEVWTGRVLDLARRRLGKANRNFGPCKVCDVDGTLQGRGHFEAWEEIYAARAGARATVETG